MMSLPVWLSNPMFLLGGLWSHVPSRGVSVSGLPDRPPPDRTPLYSKERAVRIHWNAFLLINTHPLECILVE